MCGCFEGLLDPFSGDAGAQETLGCLRVVGVWSHSATPLLQPPLSSRCIPSVYSLHGFYLPRSSCRPRHVQPHGKIEAIFPAQLQLPLRLHDLKSRAGLLGLIKPYRTHQYPNRLTAAAFGPKCFAFLRYEFLSVQRRHGIYGRCVAFRLTNDIIPLS